MKLKTPALRIRAIAVLLSAIQRLYGTRPAGYQRAEAELGAARDAAIAALADIPPQLPRWSC